MSTTSPVFFTVITRPDQVARARLAIDSLRTFGGNVPADEVWVFEATPGCAVALRGEGIRVLPLTIPDALRGYWYGAKVAACAHAETLAQAEGQDTIVWMASDCLFVQPPTLLALDAETDVAARPVHHRNVGIPASAPLDAYWGRIYASVGVDDVAMTVRSFVEDQPLRAYFNTHLVAFRIGAGLCAGWLDAFVELAGDADFQAGACSDVPHRVFLHQAPLSALIASALDASRLRILPPTYSYPYHLHYQVPPERRPTALNDLVCVATEDLSLDPDRIGDVEIRDPLRAWLSARAHRS